MRTLEFSEKELKNITIDDIDSIIELMHIGYEEISSIDISRNMLTNVNFLNDWPFKSNIKALHFSNNQLIRMPDLKEFNNLQILNINMNSNVTDLNFIRNNMKLEYLSVSFCSIKDIKGIFNSRNTLNYLNLNSNKITDISVLYNYEFKQLKELYIQKNPLNTQLKEKILNKNRNIQKMYI